MTKNIVLWFTGLSGSGKTTIAKALKNSIFNSIILDGDDLRKGLCSDLGFSVPDRNENVRRVRELAKFLYGQGFSPIVTFISPIRAEREAARKLFPEKKFIEIYLSTPLDICEKRDVKGLYKKHRELMTGIGSPYEPPEKPELIFNTDKYTVDEIINLILNHIKSDDLAITDERLAQLAMGLD